MSPIGDLDGFTPVRNTIGSVLKEIQRRTELGPRLEAEMGRALSDEEFIAIAKRTGMRIQMNRSPEPKCRKKRRKATADLAKQARRGIEDLVEALGWPKDELAFHLAIDRCSQLEDERQIDGNR